MEMPNRAVPEWQRRFERGMRYQPVDAETLLWWSLRNRELGVYLRHQHLIDRYFVDFVCQEQHLIVDPTVLSMADPRMERTTSFCGRLALR